MLDLRGWMKNSGKEMSVNLAVCDEEVGARLRSLSVLDVIVHLHTPIYGVSLYQYNRSSRRSLPSLLTKLLQASQPTTLLL